MTRMYPCLIKHEAPKCSGAQCTYPIFVQSFSRELWGNIQDFSSLAEVSKEDPEEKAEF